MNNSRDVTGLQFLLLVAMPFGIALAVVAFLFVGCQQKQQAETPKAIVSIENLRTAYGKSVQRHTMYSKFATNADRERMKNAASLFRAVARSEEIHAALHAALLRKTRVEPVTPVEDSVTVGTTFQTLKMAMSCEQLEFQSMYPNLIRTAELEVYPEAAEQFRLVKEADARHYELFKGAYDLAGRIQKVPYLVCPQCGYVLTSEQTEECPVCHAKKQQFERI